MSAPSDAPVTPAPAKAGNWLVLGCVVAPIVLFAALLGLTTVGLAVAIVIDPGSFKNGLPGTLVGLATGAALALGLAWLARRLIASVRGEPMPYLFPPAVGAVLGVVLGLACLATGIAAVLGHGSARAGRSLGVGILFLIYGVHRSRQLLRSRAAGPS